jgi:AbrB family looped-hinge helix DNA binding protein
MNTVKISPEYQVIIPENIKFSLNLSPGQKMKIIEYDGKIELIPDKSIADLKGFLRGINTDFIREDDRL